MRKYGRIIRKSYFPNLFFKQDFRSLSQRKSQVKIYVFVQIKFAFHNKIASEDFPLSFEKEKIQESSKFPLKLKAFGLKPFKPANGKNVFLNLRSGKTEPQNLYRFTFPIFSFRELRYPESTTSGHLSFSHSPIKVIIREITGCNLCPSHLRSFNEEISGSRHLNFLSATSTQSDLKSFKPNFFGNDNRVLVSKVRNRIQTLQNSERFFLRGRNLLFTQLSLRDINLFVTQSRLPVSLPLAHKIRFEQSGFISPAAYPPLFLLTASGFFQKVYDGTLRKGKLKNPVNDILGKIVPRMRLDREIKGSTGLKSSRDSEILLVPLSRLFNPQSLEHKLETGMKMIRPSQKNQYSNVKRLKKGTWEKQQIRTTKEKQDFIEIKEKQNRKANEVLCNYEKSIFKISGFATECLTHPLTLVLAESGLPLKIQNESFVKIEQLQLPVRDSSLRGDAPSKRFGTETTCLKTYNELSEPLSLLFNLYNLKGKTGKEAVKSPQRRKHLGTKLPELRIREKQELIERKAEQRQRELYNFRKIGSIVLSPFVQCLIPNIREKTAFLFNYESLIDLENPEIGCNLSNKKRIVIFPYYKNNFGKLSSTVRRLSAKETLTRKDIPRKFDKNLSIFYNVFLKEAIVGFPALYIQQLTSRQTPRIRNPFLKSFWPSFFPKGLVIRNQFLTGNNEILRVGVSSYRSASVPEDYKNNRSISHEISMPNKSSERNFFAGLTNIFQQYPETIYEASSRIFEKMFASAIVEANKKFKSVFKLSSSRNSRSKILENTFICISNYLTTLKHNLTNNQTAGFKQSGQKFQPDVFKMALEGRAFSSFRWKKTAKPESLFFTLNSHLDTKSVRRQLFSGFNVHRTLLAGNNPVYTAGTFLTRGISGLPINDIQEKESYSQYFRILKTFEFPEILFPSHITTIKGKNSIYQQKIPLSREKENIVTYTPEELLIQLLSLTRARIFKSHVVSKSNLIKKYNFIPLKVNTTVIKDIYSSFQQVFQSLSSTGTSTFSKINRFPEEFRASSKGVSTFNPLHTSNSLKDGYLLLGSHKTAHNSTKIAHYSTSDQKMENKREKKREKEYSGPIIQIGKFEDRFILPMFLKALSAIVYKFRKPEILPAHRMQYLKPNGTKTPTFGLRKVLLNLWQNHIISNISVHTETYPVTLTSNYPTTNKQSYLSFFKYFSAPSRKEILEYSGVLDSISGRNAPATTEQQSILSKTPNLIFANSLLPNIVFAGIPFISSSILSSSKTIGTTSGKNVPLYNLLKYAYSLKSSLSIVYQSPLFATKFGVSSNIETENLIHKLTLKSKFALRSKFDFASLLSRIQKPDGQKLSYWKIMKISLSPGDRKRRSSDAETFLQRKPFSSLERENNNLRINIDTPAQVGQHLFSNFVHSAEPDFTKRMKRKKIVFTTSRLETSQKNILDVFNKLLFKSNILNGSEKTASSRIHLGSERADFVFSRIDGAGKPDEITTSGTSVKERSELKHVGDRNQKTVREGLIYGTSEPLFEEVKKIKRIIFETREIVADHLGSHIPRATGNPEQVMDIEDISEKIMQSINRRLKIEAERRGIF